jgi:hypothetical protein
MDILVSVLKVFLQPYFLIVYGLVVVFLVVRRWLQIRNHEKARGEQILALTPLVSGLGGTVTGPEAATSWSAEVQPLLANHVDGAFNKLFQRSKVRVDLTLDFQRGPWHVRVVEASVRMAVIGGRGVRYEQEHRIEVSTVLTPPMRVIRPFQVSAQRMVEQRLNGWVSRRPLTAKRSQADWHPVMVLPPVAEEFYAYSTDPVGADRALNGEPLKWLQSRQDNMPMLAKHMGLTFESGLVYAVLYDHIYPDDLMYVVVTIVGMLDRMPGMRPRHPAASA